MKWEEEGLKLGFDENELKRISHKKGAAWNMVRWNRTWNTVEMRCFDTDFVGMDVGKFALCTSILKRTDLNGEKLSVKIMNIHTDQNIDESLNLHMKDVLEVKDGAVNILPTKHLHRIINLAITEGLKNDLVYSYIGKIFKLSKEKIDWKEEGLFEILANCYQERLSTSDKILKLTHHKAVIDAPEAAKVLEWALEEEDQQFQRLRDSLPRKFQPPESHPFTKMSV